MSAPAPALFLEEVHGRLAKVLGPQKAQEFIDETMRALGMSDLRTADDLMVFGTRLVQSGGFIGLVGRSLCVQALLRGAVQQPPSMVSR